MDALFFCAAYHIWWRLLLNQRTCGIIKTTVFADADCAIRMNEFSIDADDIYIGR